MVLLASAYDQSRFLKAEDLAVEKKFRIKTVTAEEIGVSNDRERKLVVWGWKSPLTDGESLSV